MHEHLHLEQLPRFVLRKSGLMVPDGITSHQAGSLKELEEFPDVIFVAIPSTKDGGAGNVAYRRES